MPLLTVAVVAFDRISPFHLSVPCAVFGEALAGVAPLRLIVCAAETGALRTSAGFSVTADHGLGALEDADVIVAPSWRDPAERPPEALLDAVQTAQRRGAQLVGLCLGAYVLAAAGVLDGRRAVTHWAYAVDFAARYPTVRIETDRLYVEDGPATTSAGASAGIDCCLHILRRLHGPEIANKVARRLVTPPHRQGGQAQYIERPTPATPQDLRLAEVIDWMRAHLSAQHSVDDLAARARMSRRTFTRRFQQATGRSVGGWLVCERLGFAQHLLESTDQRMESIAAASGFGSAGGLRQQFRAAFGVAPRDWRRTFKG